MTTRTASLMAAFIAAASFAASPAAAQTDTARAATPAVAPAAAATTAPAAAPAPRPRRNPHVITRAEMQEKGAQNVYDGIRMIRGSWLRGSRALSSANARNPVVAVYRDGAPAGGVGVLREMPVESISQVQYFEPNEAVQRFGGDAAGGALLVSTGHSGH